jgi:muconolactone delta-isomerase
MLTAMSDEQRRAIMPREVPATVRLYLDGKIDQWWVREDGQGVVFLMNVGSVEEARTLLEKLPLGQAKLMTFDLIPLGPLSPLRLLLRDSASASQQ